MEWIIVSLALLLVLLAMGAIFVMKSTRKKNRRPDYYTFFIIGICWAAVGIPLKNYFLSAMGVIFMIVGLYNRKRWKERVTWKDLNEKERKVRLIITVMLGVLVLAGLIVMFLTMK